MNNFNNINFCEYKVVTILVAMVTISYRFQKKQKLREH